MCCSSMFNTINFGKQHNGKPVSEVPEDYLRFVLAKQFGTVEERRMILRELRTRSKRYLHSDWEQFVE